MCGLEEKLQLDLKNAMKEQNKVALNVIRNIKKAIMEIKTAPNGKKELDDSDVLKIINKMAKQQLEAAKTYAENGRQELADNEKAEIEILNRYLPKPLTDDEISTIVEKLIIDMGITSMKDMGKLIGRINKEYVGRVNGSVVSAIVKERLSKL